LSQNQDQEQGFIEWFSNHAAQHTVMCDVVNIPLGLYVAKKT